jgi:hypothetical protein
MCRETRRGRKMGFIPTFLQGKNGYYLDFFITESFIRFGRSKGRRSERQCQNRWCGLDGWAFNVFSTNRPSDSNSDLKTFDLQTLK